MCTNALCITEVPPLMNSYSRATIILHPLSCVTLHYPRVPWRQKRKRPQGHAFFSSAVPSPTISAQGCCRHPQLSGSNLRCLRVFALYSSCAAFLFLVRYHDGFHTLQGAQGGNIIILWQQGSHPCAKCVLGGSCSHITACGCGKEARSLHCCHRPRNHLLAILDIRRLGNPQGQPPSRVRTVVSALGVIATELYFSRPAYLFLCGANRERA